MIDIFQNDSLEKVKKNWFYIFLEICLLVFNVYQFVFENHISIIFLIFLVVIVVVHIYSWYRNWTNKKKIPNNLMFMVDFANSIGYTRRKRINKFTDENCIIDTINKIYEIDGINVRMQKEYIGRVNSNTSDGMKMMTCGGASTSVNDINGITYFYDYGKKRYKQTKNILLEEDERSKVIKICFDGILSKDEQFKIKYVEKNWDGAMRKNYDGIVVGEQLFFKSLKEQKITLKFKNISDLRCELFKFNFKTNEVSKMKNKVNILNNECNCSIKDNDLSQNCILFLMYQYT